MTALAAAIGTGNIVGVATAIAAGGPGALFWMWVTALQRFALLLDHPHRQCMLLIERTS